LRACLNDRSVGYRIGERNAQLHNVGAPFLQGVEDIERTRKVRMSSGYVANEGAARLGAECVESTRNRVR